MSQKIQKESCGTQCICFDFETSSSGNRTFIIAFAVEKQSKIL